MQTKKILLGMLAVLVFAAIATPVASSQIMLGTSGDDVLQGTSGDDVIIARGGNDRITGGGGADFIRAGGGSDTIKVYKAVEWPNGSVHDDGADAVRCGAGGAIDYVLAGKHDFVSRTCDFVVRKK